MNRSRIILAFYGLAAVVNLASHITAFPDLEFYSKPLLMPLLLSYVYYCSKGNVTIKTLLLAAALIFSWGGDLALMYGDSYFLLGVGSFFVAQILYITLFGKASYQKIKFSFARSLPFWIYGIAFFYYILPGTGSLQIPVTIYGLSLLTMAYYARMRQGLTSQKSFQYVITGALLFLISDSLIAVDKFVIVDIPFARFLIMLTYITAQYLIVEGILKHAD